MILGVTNPFFVKTLEHWPHTIRLADQAGSSEDQLLGRSSRMPSDLSDTKPGMNTKYKPFLSKDKMFAKIISTSKVCILCTWCISVD